MRTYYVVIHETTEIKYKIMATSAHEAQQIYEESIDVESMSVEEKYLGAKVFTVLNDKGESCIL
jgi:hypothetical protein